MHLFILASSNALIQLFQISLPTYTMAGDYYRLLGVDKAAKEAGAAKGQEIFGDFGATIGAESGLLAGRRAALEMAKKMV